MRLLGTALVLAGVFSSGMIEAQPHNIVLFVPDGLRAQIVDASTAPALADLRETGVNFTNSHSLFPTFTTANASALSTGHGLGDTGDFSNTIYTRLPFQGSVTPFLENDVVLRELSIHLGGNYLNEPSIVGTAAALTEPHQISTALIGKLGPVAIFDPTALTGAGTLVIDDSTGQAGKEVPIPPAWRKVIEDSKIKPIAAPSRGNNAVPGTFITNLAQQQYFLEMTLKVVLPHFKELGKPFVLVYWTRDPDGTQHTQGDDDINGPTSMTAIRNADGALAAIEQTLKALGLYDTTNIIVAADHGFSTIAKDSDNSPSLVSTADGTRRELPPGFLALDIVRALQRADANIKLFDPEDDNKPVDLGGGHPSKGNGIIGVEPRFPQVVVASNGGSDLIYLPTLGPKGAIRDEGKISSSERLRIRTLGQRISDMLFERDYVSGLFVNDRFIKDGRLGRTPGALTLSDIGLMGAAKTLPPAFVVNFRSYVSSNCDAGRPVLLCAREISDTTYQAGGGMHGSFSRADTWNFMAARGPDFRSRYVDELPTSNADIGMTIASLLQLQLTPKGKLTGRLLTEALRGHENDPVPQVERRTQASEVGPGGLKTILKTQRVNGHTYYDESGFPGRTATMLN